MKELKSFLSSKGLECKGCSEKGDFVQMAFANQEKPDMEAPPAPESKSKEPNSEELEEV